MALWDQIYYSVILRWFFLLSTYRTSCFCDAILRCFHNNLTCFDDLQEMHFVTIAPEGHAAGSIACILPVYPLPLRLAHATLLHSCASIPVYLFIREKPRRHDDCNPRPPPRTPSPTGKLHPRNLQENCPKRQQSLRKHPPILMLDRHITLASTEVDKMDLYR